MGKFDRLFDKATSSSLVEIDWNMILELCDLIRQGDVTPRTATGHIKKRLKGENQKTCEYSLVVLEAMIKNCGSVFHQEIASEDFVSVMSEIIKTKPEALSIRARNLIQICAHAFKSEPSYRAVNDLFDELKREGWTFESLKESDAMFTVEKAPDWVDGEVCHKCREKFGTLRRKHHCRNCGQVFCGKCSSKTSDIPKYGYEREVRVCDTCFDSIKKRDKGKAEGSSGSGGGPSGKKTEQEIKEEEELQLALALSKSEAEDSSTPKKTHQQPPTKEVTTEELDDDLKLALEVSRREEEARNAQRNNLATPFSSQPQPQPQQHQQPQPQQQNSFQSGISGLDPELAKYLDRNYWEQQRNTNKQRITGRQAESPIPSAPNGDTVEEENHEKQQQNGGSGERHLLESSGKQKAGRNLSESNDQAGFVVDLRMKLSLIVNRIQSDYQRGRIISNDSVVDNLFNDISTAHEELVKRMAEKGKERGTLEGIQDKMTAIKDARAALDSLREEHSEKRRRDADEAARQRQTAMTNKLQALRQKKQEMLQIQRQQALERLKSQEMQEQQRLAQEKEWNAVYQQQYLAGQNYSNHPGQPQLQHPGGFPGVYQQMPPPPPQMGPEAYYGQQQQHQHQLPPGGLPPQQFPPQQQQQQQQPPQTQAGVFPSYAPPAPSQHTQVPSNTQIGAYDQAGYGGQGFAPGMPQYMPPSVPPPPPPVTHSQTGGLPYQEPAAAVPPPQQQQFPPQQQHQQPQQQPPPMQHPQQQPPPQMQPPQQQPQPVPQDDLLISFD